MPQPKKDFQQQIKDAANTLKIEIDEPVDRQDVNNTIDSETFINSQATSIENNRKATAPYNFVPLSNYLVEYNEPKGTKNKNVYNTKLNTGYIDLYISTLTPLYIRDNKAADNPDEVNPDFFGSSFGSIRIPGSSLRGMIRNLVEIVSFGKFSIFEDKRLYMRGLADKSVRLRDDYQDAMIDRANNFFPKVSAGYLRKNGRDYFICPAKKDINGEQFYKVPFDKNTKNVHGLGRGIGLYDFENVYFQQVARADHKHFRKDRNGNRIPYNLKYALVTSIGNSKSNSTPTEGIIINTGLMNNKHFHWLFNVEDSSIKLPVAKKVKEDYKDDTNRNSVDIFDLAGTQPKNFYPCFYLSDSQGNIIAIGHTAMFRLPYELRIGDHLMGILKTEGKIDFTDSIFGKSESFSGRVYFEDAFLLENKESMFKPTHPRLLLGPKPTTFQHYLTQDKTDLRELKNYNTTLDGKIASIRGYKQYWHKSGNDWIETNQVPENSSVHTTIRPIKNANFCCRIRFENLTNEELGAMLFVLDLPKTHAHKLGMAKPLGLGSVRINPSLYLSNRKKRYEEFIFEFDEKENEPSSMQDFKADFALFILNSLEKNVDRSVAFESLWDDERLKELDRMLQYDGKPADNMTRYMNIEPKNEFKERPVLPKPTEVR